MSNPISCLCSVGAKRGPQDRSAPIEKSYLSACGAKLVEESELLSNCSGFEVTLSHVLHIHCLQDWVLEIDSTPPFRESSFQMVTTASCQDYYTIDCPYVTEFMLKMIDSFSCFN